jgi:hypothetical protein
MLHIGPLYISEKEVHFPVGRRLGEPESWSGRGNQEKLATPDGNRTPLVQLAANLQSRFP